MAYCAVGSISSADWAEIKKLCKQMQGMIDERFRELDAGQLQILKDRLTALENSLAAVETEQATQNTRLDVLEDTTANIEITTSEILDMYNNGGN